MFKKYDIIDALSNVRRMNNRELPSQGLFYKDDMRFSISKASPIHVVTYTQGIDVTDSMSVGQGIKYIVKNCTNFSKGYSYRDLRSCDVMYVFLEIVSFTKGTKVSVPYISPITGEVAIVDFSSDNFNYFRIPDNLMSLYDEKRRKFVVNGYGYSPPTVGVESDLTDFFINAHLMTDTKLYEDAEYDFIFFLGDKTTLNMDEIENLVWAFNHDINLVEQNKISNIVENFKGFTDYSLVFDDERVPLTSKVDLGRIWE